MDKLHSAILEVRALLDAGKIEDARIFFERAKDRMPNRDRMQAAIEIRKALDARTAYGTSQPQAAPTEAQPPEYADAAKWVQERAKMRRATLVAQRLRVREAGNKARDYAEWAGQQGNRTAQRAFDEAAAECFAAANHLTNAISTLEGLLNGE